jgi:hypothetical protein
MPGTDVDLPDPVGALSNTRERPPDATAARRSSAISKTGNGTPDDVPETSGRGREISAAASAPVSADDRPSQFPHRQTFPSNPKIVRKAAKNNLGKTIRKDKLVMN